MLRHSNLKLPGTSAKIQKLNPSEEEIFFELSDKSTLSVKLFA